MGVETGHLKGNIPNVSMAVLVRQTIHSFSHHTAKFVPLKTHITLKKMPTYLWPESLPRQRIHSLDSHSQICSLNTHMTDSLYLSKESSTSTFS